MQDGETRAEVDTGESKEGSYGPHGSCEALARRGRTRLLRCGSQQLIEEDDPWEDEGSFFYEQCGGKACERKGANDPVSRFATLVMSAKPEEKAAQERNGSQRIRRAGNPHHRFDV